jgi:serine/threonine protein kinase
MEVNEKNDVYSFGVLALEILFGKHPADILSNSLQWIIMGSTLDTMPLMNKLDQRLSRPANRRQAKELVSIAKTTIILIWLIVHNVALPWSRFLGSF